MSVQLGANFGASSTGRVDIGSFAIPSLVTHFVWFMRTGEGGGSFGRILGRSTGTHDLTNDHGSFANNYAFGDRIGGQYHRWTRLENIGEWSSILVSGDTSNNSVAPRIIQNGRLVALTRVGAANYWAGLSSTATVIGNRQSDNIRIWDGYIAHYCMWDVILNEYEEEQLANGVPPYLVRPNNLVKYYPLDSDYSPISQNANAISACYTKVNPPVYHKNNVVYLFKQQTGNDTALQSSLSTQSSVTAALTTNIVLSSSLSAQAAQTSNLTTVIQLNSGLSSLSAITAALTTSIRFQSALIGQSTLTAEFASNAAQFNANLQTQSTVSASLTTAIALSSSLTALSTLSADLTTGSGLNSNLTSASTLSAGLTTGKPLVASLLSESSLTATFAGTAAQLQANLAASVGITADLMTAKLLATSLSAQAVLSASLSVGVGFAANLVAQSVANGNLSTQIRFASSLQSIASLSASVTGAAISAPAGDGFIAGQVKSLRIASQSGRRSTSNRSRPTYN